MAESDSEEEILVYAEFDSSVNVGDYRNIHVLGVNEQRPIMQMDKDFFEGKYVNPMGTYMFFAEDPDIKSSDPLFEILPEKNLKYVDKTRKCISMEHAYVSHKNKKGENVEKETDKIEDEIKPIKYKNVQQAVDSFKKEFGNNIPQNTSDQNVNTFPENNSIEDEIQS